MQIEIVTIGNEVLSGRTVDTNFAWLARALERASVQVGWHTTVGDSAERIGEALKRALERADGVVMTGGLGPTPDDLTRKAIATVLARPLQLDEAVLEHVRERVRRSGRRLPASVESMALLPRGAEAWISPAGSAPGPAHHAGGEAGDPAAGRARRDGVAGHRAGRALAARAHRPRRWRPSPCAPSAPSRASCTSGSARCRSSWPGAALAYLPSYFGVDLRVTVAGQPGPQVGEVAVRARAELMELVGDVVYAEDERTMEEALGEALVARGWRVATAESCTAGLLSKRLTDVPGSSRYFDRGFVTYSNDAKVELLGVSEGDIAAHGAVSAPIAEQMAHGARHRAGVDLGIAITGVAGPEGGSDEKPVGTVFVALSTSEGEVVRRFQQTGSRATIRERSVQFALDLARRRLLGLSLEAHLPRAGGAPGARRRRGVRRRPRRPGRGAAARPAARAPRRRTQPPRTGGGRAGRLMRLFLAVFPPEPVQRAAFAAIEALRRPGDGVSWVKRENLHYTMRFLGEVGEDGARRAAEAAAEAAARSRAFPAALSGLGRLSRARSGRASSGWG